MKTLNLKSQFSGYGKTLKNWLTEDWPKESPRDIRIGLWGTAGSGKTTYLAMLYEALTLSDDWVVSTDTKARQFVKHQRREMSGRGVFPERTQLSNELEIFSFTLTPQFKGRHSGKVILNFVDAPGEYYEQLNSSARVVGNGSDRTDEFQDETDIIDYLISCDGIIFLLDPDRSHETGDDYSMLIEDLILEFQERSKNPDLDSDRLQQYMAFCVTKTDQENLWERTQEPSKLAEEIVGERLFEKLAKNYCYVDKKDPSKSRFAFFAVSSVGRYRDRDGTWKTPVIEIKPEAPTTPSYPSENFGFDSDYSYAKNNSATSAPPSLDEKLSASWPVNSQTGQASAELRKGVDSRPFQIIDPVAWLVESIQENPPLRSRRR